MGGQGGKVFQSDFLWATVLWRNKTQESPAFKNKESPSYTGAFSHKAYHGPRLPGGFLSHVLELESNSAFANGAAVCSVQSEPTYFLTSHADSDELS